MRSRHAAEALAAVLALSLLPAAAAATRPADAVRYREWGADGPYLGSPRTIATPGNTRFGIDQYSRVDIEIDRDTLRLALRDALGDSTSNPRARSLLARLGRLRGVTEGLAGASQAAERSTRLFQARPAAAAAETIAAAIGERAARVGAMLAALREARRARLQAEGKDAGQVRRDLNAAMDPIYAVESPGYRFGYDWGAIGRLLQEEISIAARDLDAVESTGLEIEIQAHALRPGGEEFALYLPGYNTEATGPQRAVQRHHFEASPEEKELFAKYQQLAKDVGDARSAGDALVRGLRAQLPELEADFRALADSLRVALRGSEQQLRALAAWREPAKLNGWFTVVRNDAAGLPEVSAALDTLRRVIRETVADLKAVEALLDFGSRLGAVQPAEGVAGLVDALAALPVETLTRVLDPAVWRRRLAEASTALEKTQSATPRLRAMIRGPGGPVADFEAACGSLTRVGTVVASVRPAVRGWLAALGFVPLAETAGTLSVPAGQRRLGLETEINTSFDLRSVRQSIRGDERVRVDFAFFRGDSTRVGGYHDEFLLGDYGWTSRVVAGLAFARQMRAGADAWKPTASMSWVARLRRWPKPGEQGLKRRPGLLDFGCGVSTMSLDIDPRQAAEIGIAPVVSWFDDRVQIGAGYDLQAARDPWFWFFSLRLIQSPGGIGGGPK